MKYELGSITVNKWHTIKTLINILKLMFCHQSIFDDWIPMGNIPSKQFKKPHLPFTP